MKYRRHGLRGGIEVVHFDQCLGVNPPNPPSEAGSRGAGVHSHTTVYVGIEETEPSSWALETTSHHSVLPLRFRAPRPLSKAQAEICTYIVQCLHFKKMVVCKT